MTCGGQSCCERFIELQRAYDEGRENEVAREVNRIIRRRDTLADYPAVLPSCRYGRLLVAQLMRDGWLCCDGRLLGRRCEHGGACVDG